MATPSIDAGTTNRPIEARISRHFPTVARTLLGLMFFVFGLNGFLHFIPQNGTPPEGAAAFVGALLKAGYMLPLIKAVEVLAGLALLTNRFVPLALALLAPIIVNIVAFHAFLAPAGIGLTVVILAIEVYLAWSYRDVFRPMLSARVRPAGAKTAE